MRLRLVVALVALVALGCASRLPAAPPNVVVILTDDMGFSDLGCYGGEIATPNLDRLAAGGVRFAQFYNTARCCPTRASLLTGLYPHQAGVGHMTADWGKPGYAGDLTKECRTLAEVLRPAGYRTYAVGKWHVTRHIAADGPRHNWPLQRGFDRFYGMVSGGGSFYDPFTLCRDNALVSPFADPEYAPKSYYFTDAITDHAVRFVADHAKGHADKPLFLYVAYTAAHWPMHALPEDVAKYKGKYDAGYEPVRKARFEKATKLGLIDAKQGLSPQAGDWAKVPNKERESACMEVFAAMADRMDQGVGRIVAELKRTGRFDDTLVLYLQDNGGCAELIGRNATKNRTDGPRTDKPTLPPIAKDVLPAALVPPQTRDGYPVRQGPNVMPGPADTYVAYGEGWANVSNTPFREYKHWVHEGGISTPLVAHWPKGIAARGELRTQPGHLIDIAATLYDLAGAAYPKDAPPLEGRSLRPAFADKPIDRDAIYWEHEGNRAVRSGDWKLVAKHAGPWELYDISKDRVEAKDLAAAHPDKVKELTAKYAAWAARANVLPWPVVEPKQPKKKNVLFVAVDDLRPALGCAGDPHAKTPNIDKLAGRGTVFTRAYCQQAVCSPSRSSFLTGRRPDSTKVYDLVTHFRKALPDVVTLPQHFKQNGYYAHGVGKIFHPGYNDEPSWSAPWEPTKGRNFGPDGQKLLGELKAKAKAAGDDEARVRGLPVEAPDVADDALNDGWTATRAIEILRSRKGKAEPFFLAVGFAKPHLPFVAPKKYFDLFDPAKLPVPASSEPPTGAPKFAPQFGGELRAYHDIPKAGPVPEATARRLVHGYYAATSYMDAQLGRVLDALRAEGLADDTVVVLWGDHGWHLGDHGIWCKHTNYERATRAALVVSAPGQKVVGKPSDRLVEFVDVYTTLADVCGLPAPAGAEGHSFARLLDDPTRPWKAAAFSQYPRGNKDTGPLMGYAVRTDRHRYVEWRKRNGTEVVARELYDHAADPNEDRNVADEPANKAVVEELAKRLAGGWKANAPPK